MKRETVEISSPFIKLDALLKFSGIAETGGSAKEMIQDGMVLVQGEACTQRGRKIVPGMIVCIPELEIEYEVTVRAN